jgi:CheY-like chemotaxis protein
MAKYRVLVIDDTRVIRLSLKSMLEKIDAEVLELASAEELFQSSWRYLNLDLIFLDIDLPGMSGMTALIKIKEDPKWTGVPIIMLTSMADPDVVKRAIQAGIVDYIRKPFLVETLLSRVKSLLSQPLAAEQPDSDRSPEVEETPLLPYQATLTLDPSDNLPPGLVSLLPLGFGSGVQITRPASMVIPFQFAGKLEQATAAFEQHLRQNQLASGKCKITPQ